MLQRNVSDFLEHKRFQLQYQYQYLLFQLRHKKHGEVGSL